MIRVTKFRCNAFEEISYLVWDGKACVLIDPGFDSDEEFASLHGTLKQNGLKPSAILLTHAHPDHVYGVHRLAKEFGCKVYLNFGEKVTLTALHDLCRHLGHADVEDFSDSIVWIHDGDNLIFTEEGVLEFKVLLTPGHSAGGVCYLCNGKVLFSGDTLFAGCIGRSDMPGGDYDTLMHSIFTKLLPLDGDTDVLPGHGRSTTITEERMKNPFLLPFNERGE